MWIKLFVDRTRPAESPPRLEHAPRGAEPEPAGQAGRGARDRGGEHLARTAGGAARGRRCMTLMTLYSVKKCLIDSI